MSEWSKLQRAYIPEEQIKARVKELLKKFPDIPKKELLAVINEGITFKNNRYQVNMRKVQGAVPMEQGGFPPMLHLSIKRLDKEPIHDWRDMQRIKNELVGEEHEAVELYPAESRLVDTANQFHLWVLEKRGVRFPFGFSERLVTDEPELTGAKQRRR